MFVPAWVSSVGKESKKELDQLINGQVQSVKIWSPFLFDLNHKVDNTGSIYDNNPNAIKYYCDGNYIGNEKFERDGINYPSEYFEITKCSFNSIA